MKIVWQFINCWWKLYIANEVALCFKISSCLTYRLNCGQARILYSSTIRHFHNKWWRIADDVLCLFNFRARRHFQRRGKYYISRPFASSNSRTSSAGKLDWFHVNELSLGITRARVGAGFMRYFGRLYSATWKCPIRFLHWTTQNHRYTWENSIM